MAKASKDLRFLANFCKTEMESYWQMNQCRSHSSKQPFIQQINVLSTYYVPNTALEAQDAVIHVTNKGPTNTELTF